MCQISGTEVCVDTFIYVYVCVYVFLLLLPYSEELNCRGGVIVLSQYCPHNLWPVSQEPVYLMHIM